MRRVIYINIIIHNIGKDKLQKMLDESSSYAEVLRKLGLADRGGNYSTLTRAIEKYKLNLDQININRTKANIKRAKGKHNSKKINLEDILDGKIDHY